jgi:hypothetical protein
MIYIVEPATLAKEPQQAAVKPDFTIHAIKDLLDIFPPRD